MEFMIILVNPVFILVIYLMADVVITIGNFKILLFL